MQDVNDTTFRRFNVITLKTMHVLVAGLPCFELNSWLSHRTWHNKRLETLHTSGGRPSPHMEFVTYGLQVLSIRLSVTSSWVRIWRGVVVLGVKVYCFDSGHIFTAVPESGTLLHIPGTQIYGFPNQIIQTGNVDIKSATVHITNHVTVALHPALALPPDACHVFLIGIS
jgi:hypothetical protein